jgi:hypothetical protein
MGSHTRFTLLQFQAVIKIKKTPKLTILARFADFLKMSSNFSANRAESDTDDGKRAAHLTSESDTSLAKLNYSADDSFQSAAPISALCDWNTSLHDLTAAVSARAGTILVIYMFIAYSYTWLLGWIYVGKLQHSGSSSNLALIGVAAFGPSVSAFVTMAIFHRRSVRTLTIEANTCLCDADC